MADLVSAIVTTYRRPELAMRAISSIRAQTYKCLEIVIIEDGKKPLLAEWARRQSQETFRYHCQEECLGLAAARNAGIARSQGTYIAFLDDDDEWKSDKIEKQMSYINRLSPDDKRRAGVIYCGCEIRNSSGDRISMNPGTNRGLLRDAIMRNGARTVPSSCLFPRDILRSIGGYDEDLPSSVDHDIWMSLARAGYVAHLLEEPLVITYTDDNRKTMTNDVTRRTVGVRLFVEKWLPVYQEWFGDSMGRKYGYRYYTDVIVRLAVNKLMSGQFRNSIVAIRSIYAYSPLMMHNTKVLLKRLAIGLLRKLIPTSLRKSIRKAIARKHHAAKVSIVPENSA